MNRNNSWPEAGIKVGKTSQSFQHRNDRMSSLFWHHLRRLGGRQHIRCLNLCRCESEEGQDTMVVKKAVRTMAPPPPNVITGVGTRYATLAEPIVIHGVLLPPLNGLKKVGFPRAEITWNNSYKFIRVITTPVKPVYFQPFIGITRPSIYNDRLGPPTLLARINFMILQKNWGLGPRSKLPQMNHFWGHICVHFKWGMYAQINDFEREYTNARPILGCDFAGAIWS